MNYQVTWFDQDGTPYRFTFADKDAAWMKYEEGKFYGNIRKVRMERLQPKKDRTMNTHWEIVDDNDDIVSACLTINGRNVAMTNEDEAKKEAKRLADANGLRLRVRKCDGPAIYPTL